MTNSSITKSQLIESISGSQHVLTKRDVELAINCILENLTETLETGGRIEIRGFGSFYVSHSAARVGRNPKTGDSVNIPSKSKAMFKPGKQLSQRINVTLLG